MRLLYIVAALVFVQFACAFEISLDRKTDTLACIRFRGSPTEGWGYLPPGAVTQQTGAYLCRSFLPGSVMGSVQSNDCYFYQSPQYDNTLDCPYNATDDGACTVGGGGTSSVTTGYTNSILCIVTPTWSTSSGFAVTAEYMSTTGTYGTSTSRTVTATSAVTINQIRPHETFTAGTVCIPNGTTTESNAIAQAMCRTASLPASLNSITSIGSTSANGVPSLLSNLQCPTTPTATLWNGECSYDTHYYDTPQWCSPTLPVVRCPATFDITLGEPIPDLKGFQLVKLRPQGSTGEYDGGMCVQTDLIQNFGSVMCREMYGDDIDFTAVRSGYSSFGSGQIKEYISSVRCESEMFLSQCKAVAAAASVSSPCAYNRGMISCRTNPINTAFSLTEGEAGKGYLQAIVAVTGHRVEAICSDGFNQDAALAACRSVGYTPGSLATFTTKAIMSVPHVFNNVSCAPGANTLHDCKLRYSGRNNVLSHTDGQVCSGRVYLDCDIGTPSVEFRCTSGRYLQARITPTSEWGWVSVGLSISSELAHDTMCSKVTSTTADETISKTYLTISYCPPGATSLTDCIVQYTNGKSETRKLMCATGTLGGTEGPPSTRSENLALIIGLAFGAPIGFAVVCGGIVYFIKRRNPAPLEDDEEAETNQGIPNNKASFTNNNKNEDGVATVHLPTIPCIVNDSGLLYGHPGLLTSSTTLSSQSPNHPHPPLDGVCIVPIVMSGGGGDRRHVDDWLVQQSSHPFQVPAPIDHQY